MEDPLTPSYAGTINNIPNAEKAFFLPSVRLTKMHRTYLSAWALPKGLTWLFPSQQQPRTSTGKNLVDKSLWWLQRLQKVVKNLCLISYNGEREKILKIHHHFPPHSLNFKKVISNVVFLLFFITFPLTEAFFLLFQQEVQPSLSDSLVSWNIAKQKQGSLVIN